MVTFFIDVLKTVPVAAGEPPKGDIVAIAGNTFRIIKVIPKPTELATVTNIKSGSIELKI